MKHFRYVGKAKALRLQDGTLITKEPFATDDPILADLLAGLVDVEEVKQEAKKPSRPTDAVKS